VEGYLNIANIVRGVVEVVIITRVKEEDPLHEAGLEMGPSKFLQEVEAEAFFPVSGHLIRSKSDHVFAHRRVSHGERS
jgi:hypothetical protein